MSKDSNQPVNRSKFNLMDWFVILWIIVLVGVVVVPGILVVMKQK